MDAKTSEELDEVMNDLLLLQLNHSTFVLTRMEHLKDLLIICHNQMIFSTKIDIECDCDQCTTFTSILAVTISERNLQKINHLFCEKAKYILEFLSSEETYINELLMESELTHHFSYAQMPPQVKSQWLDLKIHILCMNHNLKNLIHLHSSK